MPVTPVFRLSHRRFRLTLLARPDGARFAFRVGAGGHTLHTSRVAFRSAASAERAGRRFVDEALRAWAWAEEVAARRAYSSSK